MDFKAFPYDVFGDRPVAESSPRLLEWPELFESKNLGFVGETLCRLSLVLYSRHSPLLSMADYSDRIEWACPQFGIDGEQFERAEQSGALGAAATAVFLMEGEADFMAWYSVSVALQDMCEWLRVRESRKAVEQAPMEQLLDGDGQVSPEALMEALQSDSIGLDKLAGVFVKKADLGLKVMDLRMKLSKLESGLFAGDARVARMVQSKADAVLSRRRSGASGRDDAKQMFASA